MNSNKAMRRTGRIGGWRALVALLAVAGCDFNVTNPGPAQDEFLDNASAANGVVAGAHRAYNDAWNEVATISASLTREYFPSGNTGYKGVTALERQGLTRPDDRSSHWNTSQNARWVAENAVERFQKNLGTGFSKSPLAAESYLWAAYSNRIIGETFCESVVNGGPVVPREDHFRRAEDNFTKAMDIAKAASLGDMALAAQAGRASVRASLGNWTGAVTDALAIPADFKFQTKFSGNAEEANNAIYLGQTTFTTGTTWNTFYDSYYTATRDPRTPWLFDPAKPVGIAGIGTYGRVPFHAPRKYTTADAPATLSSGREMLLLRAEKLLIDGDWQGAMTLVNQVRTSTKGATLAPWPASNLQEAWTAFARERGIELWLEGRTMWDRFRWARDKRPITLSIWEMPSTTQPVHEKGAGTYLSPDHVYCYPIPQVEQLTNPNVPR